MVEFYLIMINMLLMLFYSNYLSFTTFKRSGWGGKLIAFLPWIVSVMLVVSWIVILIQ